jgi:hypothetical protein
MTELHHTPRRFAVRTRLFTLSILLLSVLVGCLPRGGGVRSKVKDATATSEKALTDQILGEIDLAISQLPARANAASDLATRLITSARSAALQGDLRLAGDRLNQYYARLAMIELSQPAWNATIERMGGLGRIKPTMVKQQLAWRSQLARQFGEVVNAEGLDVNNHRLAMLRFATLEKWMVAVNAFYEMQATEPREQLDAMVAGWEEFLQKVFASSPDDLSGSTPALIKQFMDVDAAMTDVVSRWKTRLQGQAAFLAGIALERLIETRRADPRFASVLPRLAATREALTRSGTFFFQGDAKSGTEAMQGAWKNAFSNVVESPIPASKALQLVKWSNLLLSQPGCPECADLDAQLWQATAGWTMLPDDGTMKVLGARATQIATARQPQTADLDQMIASAPDAAAFKLAEPFTGVLSALSAFEATYLAQSSVLERMNTREREASLAALRSLGESMRALVTRTLWPSNVTYLRGLAQSQGIMINLAVLTGEAIMNHSATAPAYADLLSRVTRGFTGQSPAMSPALLAECRQILARENSEGQFRAWVNRQMGAHVAYSLLVTSEAASLFFTGGLSGTALPATHAFIRSLAWVSYTSQVVLAVNSAIDLTDRYHHGGWKGLANIDSAIDLMRILAITPTGGFVPAGVKPTWSQRFAQQWFKIRFSTMDSLTWINTFYAGYQIYAAERIASELTLQGHQISASEIRRRAVITLALTGLQWRDNRLALKRQQGISPEDAVKFGEKFTLREFFFPKSFRNIVSPLSAAKGFYQNHPSFLGGVGASGVYAWYFTSRLLIVTEGALLSYANPDFNYMNNVAKMEPLPDLRPKESALALVGINPLDGMLYFGSHAKYSHHRELAQFGDRYQVDNFESPDDLIAKLAAHAKKYGPIRYLKIMTHGRPGKLFTMRVEEVAANSTEDHATSPHYGPDDPEDGFINAAWLQKYGPKIKAALGRGTFAPDARIILWACLVGSNLDPPTFLEGAQEVDDLKVGDNFLNALGDTLLVNGGRIDASTRILIGMESVAGDFAKMAVEGGAQHASDTRRVIPVFPLDRELPELVSDKPIKNRSLRDFGLILVNGDTLAPSSEVDDISESTAGQWVDTLRYQGKRVVFMYRNIGSIILKYGIRLEGPWWQKRYNHKTFAPH